MIYFTVAGDPIPKGRPRLGKGKTYTPQRTKDAEGAVLAAYVASRPGPPPAPAWWHVTLEFYRETRRAADVDNLAKLVLDALNGHAWVDDAHVVHLAATWRLVGKGEGRTIVEARPLTAGQSAILGLPDSPTERKRP